MANKSRLTKIRSKTVINNVSKKEEKNINIAINKIINELSEAYPNIKFRHFNRLYLKDVVTKLKDEYPTYNFDTVMDTSYITPDGGFVVASIDNKEKVILIGEVKNQGTNDRRLSEGKKKQSKGNAIERLGKNVIVM